MYLRCSGVTSVYPDGSEALRDIGFSLRRGERVALIGPNGAGKSTLLRALVGVQEFDGDISVDGIALTPSTAGEIRSRVGLVFQNPDDQLFSPTVGQDVAFGPSALGVSKVEVQSRVADALAHVGLSHAAEMNPVHMSFGERRRAAIATVLSMQPHLLAMDEPASNLDPRHRRRLIDWLNAQSELTLLLASHDLDMVAETCDRVLLLSRSVLADGPARDILSDAALLEHHGLEPPLSMQQTHFR
ncbi:MAG: cobalt ABC transporter ATP-binding protein [Ignavibacteria bacterium]|nr:MAG: cobalt ABC transporter ATP-binding protein [Ignavibacteria bacterium]